MCRKNYWVLRSILLCFLVIFLSIGCKKTHHNKEKYASANFLIEFPEREIRARASDFSDDNIEKVVIEIQNESSSEMIKEQELTEKDGEWTGGSLGLPVGVNLRFTAHIYSDDVYNDEPEELFSGFVIQALNESDNLIVIPVEVIGVNYTDFPKLISITSLAGIKVSGKANVEFEVAGLDEEIITYEFTCSRTAGYFQPNAGEITLVSGTGKANVEFVAFDATGDCTFTLKLKNSVGNQFAKEFELNILEPTSGINIEFYPVIMSLEFEQTDDSLRMTATINDEDLESLSYLWSFDGGLSIPDNTVNPCVIEGYTKDVGGKIGLTVTDIAGNASSISYNLTGQSFDDPVTISVGIKDSSYSYRDLVVNDTVSIDEGGSFRHIHVLNDGDLTIKGNVFAEDILVRWGKLTINGNLNVSEEIIVENDTDRNASLIVYGHGTAEEINVSGVLGILGVWRVNDVCIKPGGLMKVVSSASPFGYTGALELYCDNLTIDEGGELSAFGVGEDPRGHGGGYGGSGGGAYGGNGGRGYWSASHAGVIFGDIYSYLIDKGSSSGWSLGGGRIFILSKNNVVVSGVISASGGSASGGGGSGGGILLDVKKIEVTGAITAKGGDGGDYCGGGGGGRIKLFYDSITDVNVVDKFDVYGGKKDDYQNCRDGDNGTTWIDAKPKSPELIIPADNTTVAATPTFKFKVVDESKTLDSRDDDLLCKIIVSTDNFVTAYKTYDQTISLQGWSEYSYKTGDEAEFTPEEALPAGTYQWKVQARDKSIWGRCSEIRTFTI